MSVVAARTCSLVLVVMLMPIAVSPSTAADMRIVHATADSGTNRFDTTFVYPTTGGALSAFTVRYFAWDGIEVTGYVDIDVDPHAASGYVSLLDIDGPDDPWGRTSTGTSSTQIWSPAERSYVWTHTAV